MKKIIKYIVKVIIFILIFVIILNFITMWMQKLVKYKNAHKMNDLSKFYDIEENSLDVIFIGSSHSFCSFSPSKIKEVSGMNSYNIGSTEQLIVISYYWLKEALKTQNPKYIVLEVFMACIDETEYTKERMVAYNIDKMKFSANKIDAINACFTDWKERIYNYVPLMKYHYAYKEILSNEDDDVHTYSKIEEESGFIGLNGNRIAEIKNDEFLEDTNCINISEQDEEYLYKIIELAKENNINLIFVETPFQLNVIRTEKLNYVKNIASENDIPYIDFNQSYYLDKMDFNTDFNEPEHLSRNRSDENK